MSDLALLWTKKNHRSHIKCSKKNIQRINVNSLPIDSWLILAQKYPKLTTLILMLEHCKMLEVCLYELKRRRLPTHSLRMYVSAPPFLGATLFISLAYHAIYSSKTSILWKNNVSMGFQFFSSLWGWLNVWQDFSTWKKIYTF